MQSFFISFFTFEFLFTMKNGADSVRVLYYIIIPSAVFRFSVFLCNKCIQCGVAWIPEGVCSYRRLLIWCERERDGVTKRSKRMKECRCECENTSTPTSSLFSLSFSLSRPGLRICLSYCLLLQKHNSVSINSVSGSQTGAGILHLHCRLIIQVA